MAIPFHQAEYLALKKSIVDECRAIDFKASRLLDCISGDLLLRLMATLELMADGNRDLNKMLGEQSAVIEVLDSEKFTLTQVLACACKGAGGRLELDRLTLAYVEGLGRNFDFSRTVHPGTGVVTVILREGIVLGSGNGSKPKAPPRR